MNTVKGLIRRGVHESEEFDLKEALPNREDTRGKHRLRKACAAFANSGGGFLVFGVAASGSASERLVGIDASLDFPQHFGSFPSHCEPPIDWQIRKPAISLGARRVIHVIHIPRSWSSPHAVEDGDGWVFPKRTNKGTEHMSFSEVRQMFLDYYEKRLKLQLLRAELIHLREASARIALAPHDQGLLSSVLPILELRVVESILGDTYSILHTNVSLIETLARLRAVVQMLNGTLEIVRTAVAVYPDAGGHRIGTYGPGIEDRRREVNQLTTGAISELDKLLDTR